MVYTKVIHFIGNPTGSSDNTLLAKGEVDGLTYVYFEITRGSGVSIGDATIANVNPGVALVNGLTLKLAKGDEVWGRIPDGSAASGTDVTILVTTSK